MTADDRQPVYLQCRVCDHTWIAAWLPMSAGTFARLLKRATCPQCGETKRIYLHEPGTVSLPPVEKGP